MRACLGLFGRLACLAALLLFALIALHNWVAAVQVFLGGRRLSADAVDFTAFYTAGTLVLHGHGGLLFDRPTFDLLEHSYGVRSLPPGAVLPFLNPPFVALLFAPLGAMSFSHALQTWIAVNLLVMLITVTLVLRAARHEAFAFRAFLVLVMVGGSPFAFSLRLGQFSTLLLAAWTCAFVAHRRGSNRGAGLALAACLIKPEIVLPVIGLLAWKRQWTVLRPFAWAALMLGLVSLAVVGPVAALHYPAHIVRAATHEGDGTSSAIMVGWTGIFHVTVPTGLRAFERPAALAASAAVLGMLAWMLRGSREAVGTPAASTAWLLVTIVTVLVDPHFYKQDAVMVAGPVCFFLIDARGLARAAAVAATMIGATILQLAALPFAGNGAPQFGMWLAVCGLVLWVSLIRRDHARALSDATADPVAGLRPAA